MDITTIADLLNEFAKTETEILNNQGIKHPTTIGAMFEGLTEAILQKAVFEGLNIHVVKNSFISGCEREFDVMLVEGDGTAIPYTNRFTFRPEQVIVIIQVKKNLYSKDIKEGFDNLRFLIDHFERYPDDAHSGKIFRDSFRVICGKDITAKQSGELTLQEKYVYRSLLIEAVLPVRIIWGYNGFSSEYNFRESFIEFIRSNTTTDFDNKIAGFGPQSLPTLIICGQYSMIKNNAMPYGVPMKGGDWWNFYSSSSYNPTKFFLETIWTRLTYRFSHLPADIFGDDLIIEPLHRFLECRISKFQDSYSWEYKNWPFSDKLLKEFGEVIDWNPIYLDHSQYKVINILVEEQREIDLTNNKEIENLVINDGLYASLKDFVEKLILTGFVYVEKNKLRMLNNNFISAVLSDGSIVATVNGEARFKNWLLRKVLKIGPIIDSSS